MDPCISCKMSDNGRCKASSLALEDAIKVCRFKEALEAQSCVFYDEKQTKKIDWSVYWGQVFCKISKSFVKCGGRKCGSFNDGSRCINDLAYICRVTGKKCPGTCNDDSRCIKKMACECGLNSWRRIKAAGGGYSVHTCSGCGKDIHLKEEMTIAKVTKQKPKKVEVSGQMSLASFGKHMNEKKVD
jgi:hypothetical protein